LVSLVPAQEIRHHSDIIVCVVVDVDDQVVWVEYHGRPKHLGSWSVVQTTVYYYFWMVYYWNMPVPVGKPVIHMRNVEPDFMTALHHILFCNFDRLFYARRDGCETDDNLHTGIKT